MVHYNFAAGHTPQTNSRDMDIICHHPSRLPHPCPTFICGGGNPYYLVSFSQLTIAIGVADSDSVKGLSCNTMCTSCFHLQWCHDGPLYRNKNLCHIAPPFPTKYYTTHIRPTLMDTKSHHCRGTHCLDHHDLQEMCGLWVTVTIHLHITVTLASVNNPTPKGATSM